MKSVIGFLCIMLVSPGAFTRTKVIPTSALEARFLKPPTTVKPYVWWHWMGSNFSLKGITKDLEAMKAAGIGGATIFNLASAVQETSAPTLNNPWPEQTYRSPAYWEAIKFAAAEAQRLDLEIGLHNTAGYSTTGGPWIDEERNMQKLVWSITEAEGGKQVSIIIPEPERPHYSGYGGTKQKAVFYRDIALLAIPDKKNPSVSDIIELTTKMDVTGKLIWNAPKGKWTIYRIGHSPTGANPHPLPDELIGKALEVDKMSAKQNAFHWKTVLDPFKEHLGEYLGKSFNHMLIDSYEAGYQNWTSTFREEFIKRKGYDPVPWIICFGQPITNDPENKMRKILGSEEETKRFEWDYRDVITQLYFENGWCIGKKLLNEANLSLQFEPYGGPFNTSQGVALADLPMGEFWTGGLSDVDGDIPAAARAAGKTIVGAEAFTGRPEVSQWTEDPAFLKLSADGAFASGVNRLVLHHWVHQPFDDKYQPGMGMGWWGTHFGRHQTWFEPGKAFFAYLGRCQAMLQYGEQVCDYLCVDKAEGFSDIISKDDFLNSVINVQKGKIVLPSGRRYAFIVFPGNGEMLPETAQKIKDLVSKGATIVSVKPTTSPGLKDFPKCDEALKTIAGELWGNGAKNSYKKGFVFTKLEDAIKKHGIMPDFVVEKAANSSEIKIVHRHSPDADLYFIVNQSANAQYVSISLRISGKQPELWQAEDCSIADAPVWNEKDGRTVVDMNLKGTQSIFVVFRKTVSKADHLVSVLVRDTTANWGVQTNKEGLPILHSSNPISAQVGYASGKQQTIEIKPLPAIELSGAWKVSFVPKLGQPFELGFPELVDFSKHSSKVVNYFSGTATYHKKITVDAGSLKAGQRILLDLGVMNDIAEVRVNSQSLGVLWYPPYKTDITDALKVGENELEIAVTNNWANRLIGDEHEPTDFEWGKDRDSLGRALKAYPEWFIKDLPRPSQGRKTFSIWYYYREGSLLKPAGLVGPVRLLQQLEKIIDYRYNLR